MLYKDTGVDIDRGDKFVESIPLRDRSFAVSIANGRSDIVVSTDGVGSKLRIAQALKKHDTIGIDLVAMSVNDILCKAAKPIGFLDYIACHKIDSTLDEVMKGILKGCEIAGCELLGGETAEMPFMYEGGTYDLAGFAIGKASKKYPFRSMMGGDAIIGLPSSGPHSNGYSIINKLFSPDERFLTPTRIYSKTVLHLMKKHIILGMAHITGGGVHNIARILTNECTAHITKWRVPQIFKEIQEKGLIPEEEMYRVFNMGIGFVLIVPQREVGSILSKTDGMVIGELKWGEKKVCLQ